MNRIADVFNLCDQTVQFSAVRVFNPCGHTVQSYPAYPISRLLNNYFFTHHESEIDWASLKKDNIEAIINASYDLRSKYVHVGLSFGTEVRPHGGFTETMTGIPQGLPKELTNILVKSPSYIGMERIMRYCLLRFIHLHGFPIDPRLDSDKTGQAESGKKKRRSR